MWKAGPVFLDKSWADCEFQYIRGKKTMNATDSNKYNILFIGPTGSGKFKFVQFQISYFSVSLVLFLF